MFRSVVALLCHYAVHGSDEPRDIAGRMAKHFTHNRVFFLLPDLYGAALDFKSLFEAEAFFGESPEWPHEALPRMNALLDTYEDIPFLSAGMARHNASVTSFADAIGDTRGLFPLVYLERAAYYARHPDAVKPPRYAAEEDMEIAAEGARKFILPFDALLPDGTIARRSGGKAWPKAKEPTYLWADDQFMGLALVTRLAEETREPEWLEALGWVVQQLQQFEQHLRDPADALFSHGFKWDGTGGERSCCKWGRANGWGLMARAEVLGAMDSLNTSGVTVVGRDAILSSFRSHAAAMAQAQSGDGRWHQVVNETSTYLETSATAMTVFAFARGVARGWLPREPYVAAAQLGWEALSKTVARNGRVRGICIPTDMYGSTESYDSRPTWSVLSVEGGVGSVVRAAVAMAELDVVPASDILV